MQNRWSSRGPEANSSCYSTRKQAASTITNLFTPPFPELYNLLIKIILPDSSNVMLICSNKDMWQFKYTYVKTVSHVDSLSAFVRKFSLENNDTKDLSKINPYLQRKNKNLCK